jgi:hypothetical protein
VLITPILLVPCTPWNLLHSSLAVSPTRQWNHRLKLHTRFVSETRLNQAHLTFKNTQPPRQYLQSNFPTLASAWGFLVFPPCVAPLSSKKQSGIYVWFLWRDRTPKQSRPPEISRRLLPLDWGPTPHMHKDPPSCEKYPHLSKLKEWTQRHVKYSRSKTLMTHLEQLLWGLTASTQVPPLVPHWLNTVGFTFFSRT